jgi:hypothetical protein
MLVIKLSVLLLSSFNSSVIFRHVTFVIHKPDVIRWAVIKLSVLLLNSLILPLLSNLLQRVTFVIHKPDKFKALFFVKNNESVMLVICDPKLNYDNSFWPPVFVVAMTTSALQTVKFKSTPFLFNSFYSTRRQIQVT